MRGGSATVLMHHSMVRLPEKPMMSRLFDERVGYFFIRQYDYGQDEHRAKPIVYWIDPATPAKWIPYIKKGVDGCGSPPKPLKVQIPVI